MNKRFYDFAEFRLDTMNHRLLRGGETIALTPKEFEVLLALVENAGNIVSKDELLEAVWKDVFVNEETLMRNVSWLRKKLNSGGGEKFIETVPKRGYLFTGLVTTSDAPEIFVEEQSVQRIRIEETITFTPDEDENVEKGSSPAPAALLPNPKPEIQNSKLAWFALAFVAFAAIGFIIYQNYFQNRPAKVVVASRVVSFSGANGRENTPAFSPDGKQLAYSWNGGEGDALDIYVKLVGAGEPLRLTDKEANEQYSTFSPDGSHVAFVREFKDYGEILLVPSLGGAERKIARLFSGNYSISYAPDGRNIAVVDTENSTVGGQYAIYLVNIETGERGRVTAPAKFAGETTPRFSPDGKSLAFLRVSANQKQELFVVPVTGGEPRQLTFDDATIHSLAWSADGRMIYFVSFRGSNLASVWRVPAVGGEPEIVSIGGSIITNLSVSPDGKTLAFVETAQNVDVWRVMADGKPAKRLIASTNNEHNPQFSPDDSRIVFLSDRTGKYEIWTADADGKNPRRITDTPFEIGSPRFSPDGLQIAFFAKDGETSNIFTISAEGGAARQLTTEKSRNILPAWSADGRWIYFTSNRAGEMNIWKMPAGGGQAVQITKGGAFQSAPAPNGKTVFYSKTEASDGLWRVSTEGGAEENIPELAAAAANKWSMSPSGIYFLARQPDQSFKIKFYDFAASQVKDTDGRYKIPFNVQGSPGANADGSIFIFSLKDQNASQIMLAELPPAD